MPCASLSIAHVCCALPLPAPDPHDDSWELDDSLLPDTSGQAQPAKQPERAAGGTAAGAGAKGDLRQPSRLQQTTSSVTRSPAYGAWLRGGGTHRVLHAYKDQLAAEQESSACQVSRALSVIPAGL